MSINKKTLSFSGHSKYGVWRMCYILVLGLLISAILLTGYFIYQTIYIGIANSNAIVATNSALNMYSLDIGAFTKSLTAIEQKKKLEGFSTPVRNIFDFTVRTTTYETSSTRP